MAFVLLLIPVGVAVGAGVATLVEHHRAKVKKNKSVKPGLQPSPTWAAIQQKGEVTVGEATTTASATKRANAPPNQTVYSRAVESFLNELRAGDVPLCRPSSLTYNGLVYHDCFRGSDLVQALVQHRVCKSRKHALAVARKLFDTGCIYHVADFPTFRSGEYFYRVTARPATQEVHTDANLVSLADLNVYCAHAKGWLESRPTPERHGLRAFSPRAAFPSSTELKAVSHDALTTALVAVGAVNRRPEGDKYIRALLREGHVKSASKGRFVFVSDRKGPGAPEVCSIAFGGAQAA